jgi:hypothetical protein
MLYERLRWELSFYFFGVLIGSGKVWGTIGIHIWK